SRSIPSAGTVPHGSSPRAHSKHASAMFRRDKTAALPVVRMLAELNSPRSVGLVAGARPPDPYGCPSDDSFTHGLEGAQLRIVSIAGESVGIREGHEVHFGHEWLAVARIEHQCLNDTAAVFCHDGCGAHFVRTELCESIRAHLQSHQQCQ